MNVISTTIEWGGHPVKIERGKVYLRAFGTTMYNHSMHYSWLEVPLDKLNSELRKHLKSNNLI